MQLFKLLAFLIVLISQCAPSTSELINRPFPSGYQLEGYQKIKLQDAMEEVSGLQWVGKDQLWAIEDESSVIYRLNPKSGNILDKRKFAKNKDIEDLLVLDHVAWVLQSNGTLYEVTSPLTKDAQTEEHHFPIKGKRDLEGIVASESEPSLYIFCKACTWDLGPEKASIFRFDLATKTYDSIPFATLKAEEINPLLKSKNENELKIQPSAVALHPIEKLYYIISSSGKWLLITDLTFKPKEIYKLDSKLFKQPEGITFDTEGNMYISNEAQDGEPNILKFAYTP